MQMAITSKKGLTLHTDLKTTQRGKHVSILDSAGYHGKHSLEKWETSQAFPKEKILLILSKSPWKQQAHKSEKGVLGTIQPRGPHLLCTDGRPADDRSPCDNSLGLLSPLLPAEVIVAPKNQEEAQDSREDDGVAREDEGASSPLNQVCSGKDYWESEGGDDDACGEEDGELLTSVAHGVRVVHQSSRYAVWNG